MSSLQIRMRFDGESVTVRDIDYAEVDRYIEGQVNLLVEEYAPKIVAKAKSRLQAQILHPEKSTGRAARSITWRRTPRGARIYMGVPYGGFVEEDTRPHDIYPRRAKTLHWTTKSIEGGSWVELAGLVGWRALLQVNVGQDHYAAHVHHPGTKGKHMIRDAVRDYQPAIRRRLGEILTRSIRESMRY